MYALGFPIFQGAMSTILGVISPHCYGSRSQNSWYGTLKDGETWSLHAIFDTFLDLKLFEIEIQMYMILKSLQGID